MDDNEFLKFLGSVTAGAVGLVVSFIAWIEKRRTSRMDDFDARLRTAVSEEQLAKTEDSLRQECEKNIADITRWLTSLCTTIEKTGEKIDRQTDKLMETTNTHNQQIIDMQKQLVGIVRSSND